MKDSFIVNENIEFSMDDRKTGLNNNFSLVGCPGSGKTNLEVYNILKMNERSHVIVDVKGGLSHLKSRFEEEGYTVMHLDLIHLNESMHYNPFSFISEENWELDILELSNALYGPITNHKDPYWDQSALGLLRGCLGFIYNGYKYDRYMENVMQLLSSFHDICEQGDSDDEDEIRVFDRMFNNYCKEHEDYVSLEYKSFSQNARSTKKCIYNTLMTAMNAFKSNVVQELLGQNDLRLETISERKTILLISIKDYDLSLHRIAGCLITQLLNILFKQADQHLDGRLRIPVQFWLDDFGSYSIPNFENVIACARSRGIGISIMFQSKAQLASVYGENQAEIIIQCCDTVIYMGGNDPKTVDDICHRSGCLPAKVYALKPGESIVMRRGEKVFKVRMPDYEKEPKYCAWLLTSTCCTLAN